jgi:xanthosine utilization system XapX-like protein
MTLQELTLILVGATVCVALVSWRSAPAVTVALLSGLVGAVAGYQVVTADGPEGAPVDVAWWFSVGFGAGAIYGAAVTRRRERGVWPMRRWAVTVLLLAPFECVALALALQVACPLYVQEGICQFGANDLLGGWITGDVFLFAVDLVVLAELFWFAPGRSRGQALEGEARSQPSTARQLALAGVWVGIAIGVLAWALTRPSELEAWRSAQPDAESVAPNLLDPAPNPTESTSGCPRFFEVDRMRVPSFDPSRVRWLGGHAPRWLPADFGLVDWTFSEEDWDADGGVIVPASAAVWAGGDCQAVALILFGGNPDSRRLDRHFTVVDEVGDWTVLAGPGCGRSAIADEACLRYVAWSTEERGHGNGVLGLRLEVSGVDRETADRIALGIPV